MLPGFLPKGSLTFTFLSCFLFLAGTHRGRLQEEDIALLVLSRNTQPGGTNLGQLSFPLTNSAVLFRPRRQQNSLDSTLSGWKWSKGRSGVWISMTTIMVSVRPNRTGQSPSHSPSPPPLSSLLSCGNNVCKSLVGYSQGPSVSCHPE